MKTFNLPPSTRLKIIKTTHRKEMHGKELVLAVSLRLEWWPADNSALNLLHPNLQDMIFWTPPEVAAQCELDGIPAVKKHIRCPAVARPWKVEGSLSGYTFTIDYGIDDSTALELYACTVDKFEVDAKDGGGAPIRFSLASNKQVTPALVGLLCGLEGTEIVAALVPPPPQSETTIDGSKGHPGLADSQAAEAERQAGDLFAEQHGDGGAAGADDDSAGPGAGSSDDAPFGEAQTGENWPFPQGDGTNGGQGGADSEGGETDSSAAEFEAGAKAAIEKATGGRRGKRTRAVVE